MATVLFLVAFFRAAPPVTRPIVLALWASAAVGSAAMAAGLVPGRTVLTPLLVLQIFAASSGFNLALRRGYYDLVLARGVPAPGLLAAHWAASIAPGIAIWLIVAALEPLVSSATAGRPHLRQRRRAGAGVEPAVGAHHAAAALRGGDWLADAAGHVAGGRPVGPGRPRDGAARRRGPACWARWRWSPTRWS